VTAEAEKTAAIFHLQQRATRRCYGRDEGYRAVEATNDAEAFQLAKREPPELIVTEEELPTFDALMARLREHPTLSSIPVVIVNPDAENGARHGDAYLLADYADITSLLAVRRC